MDEQLRAALEASDALVKRLAAVEFVLTILLAAQDEQTRLLVRDSVVRSWPHFAAADEASAEYIKQIVDDIVMSGLSAKPESH